MMEGVPQGPKHVATTLLALTQLIPKLADYVLLTTPGATLRSRGAEPVTSLAAPTTVVVLPWTRFVIWIPWITFEALE